MRKFRPEAFAPNESESLHQASLETGGASYVFCMDSPKDLRIAITTASSEQGAPKSGQSSFEKRKLAKAVEQITQHTCTITSSTSSRFDTISAAP